MKKGCGHLKEIYKNILLRWLPAVGYCMGLYVLSSHPIPEKIPVSLGADKLLHFFAYAVLGVFFFRAFKTLKIKINNNFFVLASIFAATLYGITDEIHQHYITSRCFDVLDIICNMLGSIFGVYFYKFSVCRHYMLRKKNHGLTKP